MPAPHPERDLIRIRWPDLAAYVLREANSGLPVSFKVFVNDDGAVSLTVIDTSVPAASYSPFFNALTHKLNQFFPVGDNPRMPFRLAPTYLQFAIHGLPSRPIPKKTLPCVISFSPPYLTLSPFLLPKPVSSTLIAPPASTTRRPSLLWSRSLRRMVSS